jgi:Na+-transporting NADH:ubiquinone oxidoreductase subunit NqrF
MSLNRQILIKGLASKTLIKTILLSSTDSNENLMQFLRSQNIPIASSCFGEGVCQKCVINATQLSCQFSVTTFCEKFENESKVSTIEVSYL